MPVHVFMVVFRTVFLNTQTSMNILKMEYLLFISLFSLEKQMSILKHIAKQKNLTRSWHIKRTQKFEYGGLDCVQVR